MQKRFELTQIEQKIIIFLLENGESTITDMIRNSGISPNAIERAVRSLLERGLVVEKREDKFPKRRFISLTEKGVRVATIYRELNMLLSESSEEEKKSNAQ